MARRRARWLVVGIVAVVVAGALLWRVLHPGPGPGQAPPGGHERGVPGFAGGARGGDQEGAAVPDLLGHPSGAPKPEAVPQLMTQWRQGIVDKNETDVLGADEIFRVYPEQFIEPLTKMAGEDPEDRVRSFSARQLGKVRAVSAVPVLRRLLSDKSEFVRNNAAWALGELGDRASAAELRRLHSSDSSALVRKSAGEALDRLDGPSVPPR